MQIMDLPARVRHTRGFLDGAAAIQLGVAGERVGLQHTGEVSKMPLRMLAAAIRCVGVEALKNC